MNICKYCLYQTDSIQHYNKHLLTTKHINNLKKNIDCRLCNSKFDSQEKLLIHEKKCLTENGKRIINELELKNKELTNLYDTMINDNNVKLVDLEIKHNNLIKENNSKYERIIKKITEKHDNIIEKLNDKFDKLHLEYNKNLKTINNRNNIVIKSSVNNLNYIIQNFTDAPVLEQITDYSIYKKDENFINEIIYYYEHKKLDEYIGDHIVKLYKKKIFSEQSLWNTDSSRFSYIIRTIIDDNPDWIVDKNAVKVKNYLITPLLEYIKTELNKNIKKILKVNYEVDNRTAIENLKKVNIINDMIDDISDGVIATEILKYITPQFYINKNMIEANKQEIPLVKCIKK